MELYPISPLNIKTQPEQNPKPQISTSKAINNIPLPTFLKLLHLKEDIPYKYGICQHSLCPLLDGANPNPKNYIAAHNAIRAEVGVEPLHWNTTLASYAQNYANTKIATCQMEHSRGPYGENLEEGYEVMTAKMAVSLWADEKKHYDYNSNTCVNDSSHCLHYTQLVWRNTKFIGCAQVKCQNNWVFLICNYYPPGNYVGQHPY